MLYIRRAFNVLLSVIPLLIGIFALSNNISSYDTLLKDIVEPLMTMDQVSNLSIKSWRSIHNPLFIHIACYTMMLGEFAIGLLTFIGFLKMLKSFFKPSDTFNHGKQWVMNGCLLGVLIWGLGFFTIGGDYFLSWQNPTLQNFQSGALNYVLLMFIVYILLRFNE